MTKKELIDLLVQIDGTAEEIKSKHDEIATNEEQIKQSYAEALEVKKELDDMLEQLRADIETSEELKKNIQEQKKQYEDFYKKIETELLSGATTVSLAKDFNDKVKGYRWACRIWEMAAIGVFAGAIIYFIYTYTSLENAQVADLLLSFIPHLPIFSIIVWLLIFIGNRRAENLKLGESYKHKVAMAKSFTGYKKTIKELEDDDRELLTKLMTNLLETIKKDSSEFLSAKGEGHPLADALPQLKGSQK